MTDIHIHVVPGVDDGASCLEESIEMLRMASEQGVDTIIATPHSWAFWNPRSIFDALKSEVEQQIPIRLFYGMEVASYGESQSAIVSKLDRGEYASLNGTRYVLTEFSPYGGTTEEDALSRLRVLLDAGYVPVIAHAERYAFTTVENMSRAKDMGCKLQINSYSVDRTKNLTIKRRTRALLDHRLVDFLGSDAHRLDHRPPDMDSGISYLREHYDPQYVQALMSDHAEHYLLA